MKKGITLNELAVEIARQKEVMADYVIEPSRLFMDTSENTPKLRIFDSDGKDRIFPLTIGVYAHRQIAKMINVELCVFIKLMIYNCRLIYYVVIIETVVKTLYKFVKI